jgi:hypothetical protein
MLSNLPDCDDVVLEVGEDGDTLALELVLMLAIVLVVVIVLFG